MDCDLKLKNTAWYFPFPIHYINILEDPFCSKLHQILHTKSKRDIILASLCLFKFIVAHAKHYSLILPVALDILTSFSLSPLLLSSPLPSPLPHPCEGEDATLKWNPVIF